MRQAGKKVPGEDPTPAPLPASPQIRFFHQLCGPVSHLPLQACLLECRQAASLLSHQHMASRPRGSLAMTTSRPWRARPPNPRQVCKRRTGSATVIGVGIHDTWTCPPAGDLNLLRGIYISWRAHRRATWQVEIIRACTTASLAGTLQTILSHQGIRDIGSTMAMNHSRLTSFLIPTPEGFPPS